MTTPSNDKEASTGRPSFLDELLKESSSIPTVPNTPLEELPANPSSETPVQNISTLPPKKQVPITPGQIFQAIGALLFVALVFFGSFLAYIVFNPTQAKFFNTFGINTADVASLLSKLVNGIFGSLTFILSCVFAYFLFRTYLAK